jgi:hypothetical protein
MTSLSLTKVFSPSYSPRKSSRSNLRKKMPAFTPSSPQSSPSPSSSSPPTKKQCPSCPKKKAPVNGKKATTSTKKKAKAVRKATVFASIVAQKAHCGRQEVRGDQEKGLNFILMCCSTVFVCISSHSSHFCPRNHLLDLLVLLRWLLCL